MSSGIEHDSRCIAEFEKMMSDAGNWNKAIEKTASGEYKYSVAATSWKDWRAGWIASERAQKDESERAIAEVEAIANNAIDALRKISLSNSFAEMQEIATKQFCKLNKRMDKVYE